ncbi:MAG TPA: hypothetical protein VF326_06840 [Anaerolineaceae bacterium]
MKANQAHFNSSVIASPFLGSKKQNVRPGDLDGGHFSLGQGMPAGKFEIQTLLAVDNILMILQINDSKFDRVR